MEKITEFKFDNLQNAITKFYSEVSRVIQSQTNDKDIGLQLFQDHVVQMNRQIMPMIHNLGNKSIEKWFQEFNPLDLFKYEFPRVGQAAIPAPQNEMNQGCGEQNVQPSKKELKESEYHENKKQTPGEEQQGITGKPPADIKPAVVAKQYGSPLPYTPEEDHQQQESDVNRPLKVKEEYKKDNPEQAPIESRNMIDKEFQKIPEKLVEGEQAHSLRMDVLHNDRNKLGEKQEAISGDIEKAKIYFNPEKGEKAPEGAQTQRGTRGGMYYESKSDKFLDIVSETKDKININLFKELESLHRDEKPEYMKKFRDNLYGSSLSEKLNTMYFDHQDSTLTKGSTLLRLASAILSGKRTSEILTRLKEELIAQAESYNQRYGEIPEHIDIAKNDIESFLIYAKSKIDNNLLRGLSMESELSRDYLKKRLKGDKVTLYRAIRGEISNKVIEYIKNKSLNDYIEVNNGVLTSFSLDKDHVYQFGNVILKITLSIDNIFYSFDYKEGRDPKGYVGEHEVLVEGDVANKFKISDIEVTK